MKIYKHQNIAASVAALLLFAAGFTRCASVMTPQGGPKDTIPPVITLMTPDNFKTNFTDKKIYIEFNEYVQLKDQQKEFFTSPAMKTKPTLSIRGRGVVVQIKDTLRENTTYALDFGNSIRDNNESNPLSTMRYIFSTGAKLDSMMCSGYTADSYKADSVGRTFIWFYAADSLPDTPDYDSTMLVRKPDVIARAQNNGIFIAQNLKPIPYRIYAYKDSNDNQLYDAGTDMVGFIEGVHNPAELPEFAIWFDSLRMYPSAEPQLYFRMFTDVTFKNQRLSESSRPLQHKALLYFNTARPQIESIRFDSIPDRSLLIDPITVGRDTVALWFNVPAEQLPDTLRGEITYFKHDSLRQLTRTTEKLKLGWKFIETKEQEREREKLERDKEKAQKAGEEWTEPTKPNPFKYKLSVTTEQNPEQGITLETDYPLTALDTEQIQLLRIGDNDAQTAVPLQFSTDTMSMSRRRLSAKFVPATKYKLLIPKGALTDVAGYRNDSITTEFTTLDPEKFATVSVNVRAVDGERYVLQLTSEDGKTVQQERTGVVSGKYVFRYVPAGKISLRIIEDKNGNGRWDAGNLIERRQPERSEMYADPKGETVFTTKVNWEFDVDMDMQQIFAPVTVTSLREMLDERERVRLKKLAEEEAKKRGEKNKDDHNHNSSSGNSMMGGASGMFNTGGLRTNNTAM